MSANERALGGFAGLYLRPACCSDSSTFFSSIPCLLRDSCIAFAAALLAEAGLLALLAPLAPFNLPLLLSSTAGFIIVEQLRQRNSAAASRQQPVHPALGHLYTCLPLAAAGYLLKNYSLGNGLTFQHLEHRVSASYILHCLLCHHRWTLCCQDDSTRHNTLVGRTGLAHSHNCKNPTTLVRREGDPRSTGDQAPSRCRQYWVPTPDRA